MILTNLLTNLVIATWFGIIPTNTTAFQDYAFGFSLTNAQALSVRWHLDQSLITSNLVTYFRVQPRVGQFSPNIQFADRYDFGTTRPGFLLFWDDKFRENEELLRATWDKRYGEGPLRRLMEATNLLTMQAAEEIATSAIQAYGASTNQMLFHEPKVKEQFRAGGHDLPYYKFEWQSEKGRCKIQVSGVISNLTYFEFEGPDELRVKPPPNYLELLGYPTNTIFVKELSNGVYETLAPGPAMPK